MIRATTNGVLKGYRRDLMHSFVTLNKARDTVLTQRNFNSYMEDPAAAARSFQLRRSFQRVDSQYDNSESVIRKYESAYSALDGIVGMVDNEMKGSAWSSVLAGANTPTGAGRAPLGQQLTQLSESIIQSMNTRYGDHFIFSGADGLNVPFTWKEGADGAKQLCYRGIPVEPTAPKVNLDDDGKPIDDGNGNYTLADGSGTIAIADYEAAVAADEANQAKLDELSKEARYLDIGLGLQEDLDGNLIEASAFNSALVGINFLGYGVDGDGDPKNVASIIQRMGTLLSNCDENGTWANTADGAEYDRLAGKLKTAADNLKKGHVELTAQADFLKDNHTQLESTAYTLNEQILGIDQCDLADAITAFSWAQYSYNAALKMGNSILSQSLMDYMN